MDKDKEKFKEGSPARKKFRIAAILLSLLILSGCGGKSKLTVESYPPDILIREGNQLFYNGERVFLVSYNHYGEMCENRLTPYDGQYGQSGAWQEGLWRNDLGWHWKAYLDLISDAGLNFVRIWLYTSRNTRGASYLAGNCGDDLAGLLPWKYDGTKWKMREGDESYWQRLREFCQYAWQRGMIVQLCLFARQYTPASPTNTRWLWCPLNPYNNVDFPWIVSQESYYATSGEIWNGYVEQIIQKTVASVGDCGNVIYEIMNEENRRRPRWAIAVTREICRQYEQQGKKGSLLISNNIVYPGVMINGSHNSRPVTGKIPGIASDDYIKTVDDNISELRNRLKDAFAAWAQGNVGYEHKTYDFLTKGDMHTCDSRYELGLINADEVNLLARYARGAGGHRQGAMGSNLYGLLPKSHR